MSRPLSQHRLSTLAVGMHIHAIAMLHMFACYARLQLLRTFDRSGFSGMAGSTPRWCSMNFTTCARMSAFTPGIGTSVAVGSETRG